MRKVVVATAVVVPLVSAGVVFGLPGGVDECWRRMEDWAKQAEHTWQQRDFARAPVWGEVSAGDAFADYDEALELADELGRGDEELLRKLRIEPDQVSPAAAEDFLLRWRPALAAMSRGAHRGAARPPVDWARGFANEVVGLLVCRDLVNAATIEVRQLLEGGQGRQAVELTLDTLTFGSDLLQSPVCVDQMVASALVAITAGETWTDTMLRNLRTDDLRLLAAGLAAVDARCPVVFDWRGESLLLANTLLQHKAGGRDGGSLFGDVGTSLRSFEYGWSERWAAADAVLQQVELWEQLRGTAPGAWSERERQLETSVAGAVERGNPVLKLSMTNLAGAERSLRSAAAVVRLLRAAVAVHLGEELQLVDPLGDGAMRREPGEAGAVVLRSAAAARQRSAVFERTVAPR